MKSITLTAAATFLGSAFAKIQPVEYVPNASGVVVSNVGTVTAVTADLGVPTLNSTGSGQAVVGIDTPDCAGYLLAGIQWDNSMSGLKLSAFAQWGNSAPVVLDLEVGPKDSVDLQVESNGETGGTATVINASTRKNSNMTFTGQTGRLCHKSASWLVISPSEDGNGRAPYADLADFGQVDFVYPQYSVQEGDGGVPYALKQGQGTIWEMDRGGKVLATTRIESVPNDTNTVTVIYNNGA